tara:strand:+ start:465 stop:1253 length:789 start_codon:yes stop_codon:yes gene_type:complete
MFIHNIDPVAINFFNIEIRWYSLAYIAGILLGWFFSKRIIENLNSNNKLEKINPKIFDELIPYLVLGIIIGGRLGYVIIYNLEYYLKNLLNIFFIWEGGMSFHGGLIGIIIAVIIFCKKNDIKTFIILDIISIVAPIGIFFGRIANFINGELYGKLTKGSLGVIFQNIDNNLRHPSQLYEATAEGLLLFLILCFFALKKKYIYRSGITSGLFLILYSFFRFFLEYFREPDVQIGYLMLKITTGQLLSLIMFFVGIVLIYKKK